MAAITDPNALDKLLSTLKKHDRSGTGRISKNELSALLRALDPTGYWTDARLAVLLEGGDDIDLETFVRALYAEATTAASGVDFQALRNELVALMEAPGWDDGSYAPLLIRLAWHSSGTYNRADGTGGSNGATMRHDLEAKDPENAGLSKARSLLEPVQAKYPGLTHADLWILAAYVAIEVTGGPRIPFTGGRIDAAASKAVAPGRLPGAETGIADGFDIDAEGRFKGWENSAQHIRDVFYRMGLGDREVVALLSGGHVYGRCHNEHSGYAGAWVENPTFFSNEYAADLIGDRWQAVTNDTKLSDGGSVPEEVRPNPGKRQYIDLTKYEPEEEEQAAIATPNATEFPPGQYKCVSQWVNCRELPDTTSPIIGRFVQEAVLSLLTVKVFSTAVRGLTERGGWVSIVGSAGKTLFERVGDLDEQALTGSYRVMATGGAPIFPSPGQAGADTGRVKEGEEVACSRMQLVSAGDKQFELYGQLSQGNNANAWVLIFTPTRGSVAELIVQNYNEVPRKPIKGQSGHQMMLVTDMVMLWDAEFRKHLEVYAEDADVLSKDFGESFRRLTELGCPWSNDKNGGGGAGGGGGGGAQGGAGGAGGGGGGAHGGSGGSAGCPASGSTSGMCPVMGMM